MIEFKTLMISFMLAACALCVTSVYDNMKRPQMFLDLFEQLHQNVSYFFFNCGMNWVLRFILSMTKKSIKAQYLIHVAVWI